MKSLRALPLLLLFSGQVFAGGVGSALHQCRAKAKASACACKHAMKKQAADQAALRAPPCCQNHFELSDPPLARTEDVRAPLPDFTAWQVPLPVEAGFELAAAVLPRREAGPGLHEHGPPLYLRVRTLLI